MARNSIPLATLAFLMFVAFFLARDKVEEEYKTQQLDRKRDESLQLELQQFAGLYSDPKKCVCLFRIVLGRWLVDYYQSFFWFVEKKERKKGGWGGKHQCVVVYKIDGKFQSKLQTSRHLMKMEYNTTCDSLLNGPNGWTVSFMSVCMVFYTNSLDHVDQCANTVHKEDLEPWIYECHWLNTIWAKYII